MPDEMIFQLQQEVRDLREVIRKFEGDGVCYRDEVKILRAQRTFDIEVLGGDARQIEKDATEIADLRAQLEAKKLKWQTGLPIAGKHYHVRWLLEDGKWNKSRIREVGYPGYFNDPECQYAGPIEPPEEI